MYYIARAQGSKTHPARTERMLAIKAGWNKATTPSTAGDEIALKKPTELYSNAANN
jgi:hypothetical protein